MNHAGLNYDNYNAGICFIYIFKIGDSDIYKVGVTYDYCVRRTQIAGKTKQKVKVIYFYEFNMHNFFIQCLYKRFRIKEDFERWVHFKLSRFRIKKREWYKMNDEELGSAISIIQNNKIIPFYCQFGCLRDWKIEKPESIEWYRDFLRKRTAEHRFKQILPHQI